MYNNHSESRMNNINKMKIFFLWLVALDKNVNIISATTHRTILFSFIFFHYATLPLNKDGVYGNLNQADYFANRCITCAF